jgi:hypothetical protein
LSQSSVRILYIVTVEASTERHHRVRTSRDDLRRFEAADQSDVSKFESSKMCQVDADGHQTSPASHCGNSSVKYSGKT